MTKNHFSNVLVVFLKKGKQGLNCEANTSMRADFRETRRYCACAHGCNAISFVRCAIDYFAQCLVFIFWSKYPLAYLDCAGNCFVGKRTKRTRKFQVFNQRRHVPVRIEISSGATARFLIKRRFFLWHKCELFISAPRKRSCIQIG